MDRLLPTGFVHLLKLSTVSKFHQDILNIVICTHIFSFIYINCHFVRMYVWGIGEKKGPIQMMGGPRYILNRILKGGCPIIIVVCYKYLHYTIYANNTQISNQLTSLEFWLTKIQRAPSNISSYSKLEIYFISMDSILLYNRMYFDLNIFCIRSLHYLFIFLLQCSSLKSFSIAVSNNKNEKSWKKNTTFKSYTIHITNIRPYTLYPHIYTCVYLKGKRKNKGPIKAEWIQFISMDLRIT